MFSINDTVMYGTVGVCRVEGVEELTLGRESKPYYVLRPVSSGGSTVYIPLDNDVLLGKVRTLLTAEEINTMLTTSEFAEDWADDSTARAQHYAEIIKSGDRVRIISVMLTLSARRRSLSGTGKKLRISDERALRDCERIISDEFSYILGISPDKVTAYIKDNVTNFN